MRLGHASLVPFQAGRVGGPAARAATAAVTERPDGWPGWTGPDLGGPEPARPAPPQQEAAEITDLKVLVAADPRAAAGMGIPAQHSPWLPPLPGALLLSELAAGAAAAGQPARQAAAGAVRVADLPRPAGSRTAALEPRPPSAT